MRMDVNPDLKQWLMVLTPALVPTLAVLIAMLQNATGLSALGHRTDDTNNRLDDVNRRIDDLRDSINTRFDDAQKIWRAELHRVEEVLDARLKHLEER